MARTREFDVDVALERAMRLFWRHGYESTSIEDLTTELGIAKPSLYAAFGNKRALFERVLDRYAAGAKVNVDRVLAEPRAEDVARAYLMGYLEMPADCPRGCLLVLGAHGPDSADVQAAIDERRRRPEAALIQRLTRAQKEGDLPPDARPADLARFLTTVAHGIAVQAAGGMPLAQLRRIAEVALLAWPKSARS